MEQIKWEAPGIVKHLGDSFRLSCIPKQEMLKLAGNLGTAEMGFRATRLKENKSSKLKFYDR